MNPNHDDNMQRVKYWVTFRVKIRVKKLIFFSCDGGSIGPIFRVSVCVSVCVWLFVTNKYASTNIAATRVLANTKQKAKSISQYQTNKMRISEREKAELKN